MVFLSFLTQGIILLPFLFYLVYKYYSHLKHQRNLPPGPTPIPFLGNIRDFPPPGVPEYQHWIKHNDHYGPVSSVGILGTTMVIIHDQEAAHELLERSSIKTSGRPTMVFAGKMCGYDSVVLPKGQNNTFRRQRKLLHQVLGTKLSSDQFRDVHEAEVSRQLARTLEQPDKWLDHLITTTAATILKVTYGYSVEPDKQDVLTELIERVMQNFSKASVPLAWAVDILPILQYIPHSFPGATFQKTAREYRDYLKASAQIPYRFVQRQMASQNYRPSYVSNLIQQSELKDDKKAKAAIENEQDILWTALILYGAGAETTVVALQVFTLAMVLFPEVQRTAQEEIDRVIGLDRLPNFDDQDKLPYINAVVKETLRWWPVAAMGLPHTADEDLEYNNMKIPKGIYLLAAVWWFLHDPDVYANPDKFEPERFLSPRNEPDPDSEAFGYGRRKCPGRFFASSSLYLNIAQSLATLRFRKAVGPDGREVPVEAIPKPGSICHVAKFQCRVTPRSPQHTGLIKEAGARHPWEPSDSELLESPAAWMK